MAKPSRKIPLRRRRPISFYRPSQEEFEKRAKDRLEMKAKLAPMVAETTRIQFNAFKSAGFTRAEALGLVKTDGHCC